MELKSIKVAGFKSFADPTVIPLQSRLTAIVGPNGCGKSNVVDAVRCVLSGGARQLRGGSLGDIVFNGSTNRKPVGQAAVELLFDNSDGRLQGEYAAYNQICIRREISRDGGSQYYLNGTRCRRRDAVDLILGTGLKYAIVEQGMITRLIEAKPEDLRLYLEEAAGTSQYKERRREAENRLRHTKENLERLSDVRLEQEKQLSHLQRQANAAEKYQILKQEEQLVKAQLQALNWRNLAIVLVEQEANLQAVMGQLETHQLTQTELQIHIKQCRDQEQTEALALADIQAQYYEMGTAIVRVEQQLQQHRQQQQQLQQELLRLEQTKQGLQQHCAQDQQRIQAFEQEIIKLEPHILHSQEQVQHSIQHLQAAEQAMQQWQKAWDEFQHDAAKTTQLVEVEQTRLQHLQQTQLNTEQRLNRMQQEQQQLQLVAIKEEIKLLNAELDDVQANTSQIQKQLQQTLQSITAQRAIHSELSQQLDKARQTLQQSQGRHASLQALQQAALGNNDQNLVNWLQAQNLMAHPRLVQTLQVTPGWELAVETVLGDYLQAVCVENVLAFSAQLADFKQGQLSLIQPKLEESKEVVVPATISLQSKIKGDFALPSWLEPIYVADDLTSALILLANLKSHESVITRDGIWLAPQWVRIAKPIDVQAGLLQREAELQTLVRNISHQEQAIAKIQQQLTLNQTELVQIEQQRDQWQQQLREQTTSAGSLQAQLSAKNARLEHMQQRTQVLAQELQETQLHLTQTQLQAQQTQANWQQASQLMQQQSEQRQILLQEREHYQQYLVTQRKQTQTEQQTLSQQQMQLESTQKQVHFLQQTVQRAESQLLELADNQQTLQEELSTVIDPQQALAANLQTLVTERTAMEQALQTAQQQVNLTKSVLVQQEKSRTELEEQLLQARDALEQARIQQQVLQLKQTGHLEKILELGAVLDDLLNNLPPEAEQKMWEEKVVRVEQRIQRLGAINLAAIEEYQQLAERNEYLNAQHNDLLEAIATLESAIRKIDQESRTRLQDTYDKVNESFKTLFQRIFNGGNASLELTEDNWQSTGIVVRAQPPGKRNSTIHLLSGGEKSLTAIALIFALFQLNPAPFCMLDEVDAALDEANVARFCHLVKEMALQVQFIFISHNKQTIATAQQLIGITMHEPGVSRMVAVDMEEAMALAAV